MPPQAERSFRPRSIPDRLIEPTRGWRSLGLGELWAARNVLYILAWRDVKVRHTEAVLGIAWAVIQPLLMMGVFAVSVGRLLGPAPDEVPYTVFVFSGLVLWIFFVNSVTSCTNSLVSNPSLISKVYFPRLTIPLAAMLAWLPDLGIASLLLLVIMALEGLAPAATSIFLPLVMAFAILATAGACVWLSALNVAYRDVRYGVPFFLQLGLFATPVVYPATLVPGPMRAVMGLNPMTGPVEGLRWSILGQEPNWTLIVVSALSAVVVLATGVFYFRRMEQSFADVI